MSTNSCSQLLTGISYIAPHLNNLYFLTLCQRYGVYTVIRWLFLVKLALSVAMLLAGADQVYLLCIFIARYSHTQFRYQGHVLKSWKLFSYQGSSGFFQYLFCVALFALDLAECCQPRRPIPLSTWGWR